MFRIYGPKPAAKIVFEIDVNDKTHAFPEAHPESGSSIMLKSIPIPPCERAQFDGRAKIDAPKQQGAESSPAEYFLYYRAVEYLFKQKLHKFGFTMERISEAKIKQTPSAKSAEQ